MNEEMRSVFALENFGHGRPWKWPVLALRDSGVGEEGQACLPSWCSEVQKGRHMEDPVTGRAPIVGARRGGEAGAVGGTVPVQLAHEFKKQMGCEPLVDWTEAPILSEGPGQSSHQPHLKIMPAVY